MKKVSEEAEKFAGDVKDTAEDIGNRWTDSTTEEKITMIVGIILLIRALFELADIVRWIILLTIWLLAVSGFFDHHLKNLISYCKKEFWNKKRTVSSTARPAEKKSSK